MLPQRRHLSLVPKDVFDFLHQEAPFDIQAIKEGSLLAAI